MGKDDVREKGGLQTLEKRKTERPHLYEVLLHNDDYTSQEFVIWVLMKFFAHPNEEAQRIMLHVHHNGIGVAGVFAHDVAETKVHQVTAFSRENEMPLRTTMRRQ